MARRRRTWDLSQLSAKYPWLRVDSETLEEFRAPFQWVRDGEGDDSGAYRDDGSHGSSSDSNSSATHEKPQHTVKKRTTRRRAARSHRRYSLAGPGSPTTRRRRSPSPHKRPRPERTKSSSVVCTTVVVAPVVVASPRSARSERDDTAAASVLVLPLVTPTPTEPSPPITSALYADMLALKAQQRHRKRAPPPKPTSHSLLSLSFPVLRKPANHKPPAPNPKASLQALQHEQRALHSELLAQIERDKAALPLAFLFERRLDQAYCRQQSVATITAIFAKLQHRLLFYGFERWRALRDAQREIEQQAAAHQRAQRRALAFLERVASDAYVGSLSRAFARWRRAADALRDALLTRSATAIQRAFRRRRTRVLLRQLRRSALDREQRRALELQRLLAFERYGATMKWRALALGVNLVQLAVSAKRITLLFRRIRLRKRIERRVARTRAAIAIQCRWRVTKAWRARQKLQRAREIQRERERHATVHMQRRARGYLARQHAALRRVQRTNAHESACSIQRAWRRHRACVALKDRFRRRRQAMDELARIEAVRHDVAKRDAMAVRLQRVARGFLARHEAARRRHERKREEAARRIQRGWRHANDYRVLATRFAAQREKLERRRVASALLLQCRVRVFRARRERDALLAEKRRRRASAVAIQRVTRGALARRELVTQRRASVTIQSAWRCKQARDERERRVEARQRAWQLRLMAALTLQRVARGYGARRVARQLRREQRQLEALRRQSAVLIQKRARGAEARLLAALLREALAVVDAQQKRAFSLSTQRRVNESALLAFVAQHSLRVAGDNDVGSQADDPEGLAASLANSREQRRRIQHELDAAKQQLAREDRAVVLLQRRYRGYVTLVEFAALQLAQKRRAALEERTARTLQRVARGFLARRRVRALRRQRRNEALKAAYVRERQWHDQQRAFEDQYRQEQLALQLERLRALEAAKREAQREAEVAVWKAQAAAARRRELEDEREAKLLEQALRPLQDASSSEGEEEEEDEEEVKKKKKKEEEEAAWSYVADAYGRWYYYNAATGESAWEKPAPAEPEAKVKAPRPVKEEKMKEEKQEKQEKLTKREASIKKDKPTLTGSRLPSSESSDKKPDAEANGIPSVTPPPLTETPEGFCVKCRVLEADKECVDCLLPDLTRDALYCHTCFTLEHNLLAAASKARHDFKVLRALTRPSVCEHQQAESGPCGTPASYYCGACASGTRFSCETCFPKAHATAQTSSHVPAALHFRAGALRCVECALVLATRACTTCDEAFCAPCFDVLHAHASKAAHEFTALEVLKEDLASEKDAYCVDCEVRRCAKLCNLCGDGFCDACFDRAHAKGHKAQHTSIPWAQFATHGDWLEIRDDATGKTIYFNIETKESTHTQPFVLQSGDARHRALFQEREAAMKTKAIELESEIVKLKEQLQSVAQEKDREMDRLMRRKGIRGAEEEQEENGGGQDAAASKKKTKGLLGSLFGSSAERKKKKREARLLAASAADAKKLTPDEAKRLALQQSVQPELALVTASLTTRERAAKETKARQTIGTKNFEQAMLKEFVEGP